MYWRRGDAVSGMFDVGEREGGGEGKAGGKDEDAGTYMCVCRGKREGKCNCNCRCGYCTSRRRRGEKERWGNAYSTAMVLHPDTMFLMIDTQWSCLRRRDGGGRSMMKPGAELERFIRLRRDGEDMRRNVLARQDDGVDRHKWSDCTCWEVHLLTKPNVPSSEVASCGRSRCFSWH